MKEFLYAVDLVLVGDYWKEVEEPYVKWKKFSESKESKVHVNNTKRMKIETKPLGDSQGCC